NGESQYVYSKAQSTDVDSLAIYPVHMRTLHPIRLHLQTCMCDHGGSVNFVHLGRREEYDLDMGILLLIVLAFFIMGGVHVGLYLGIGVAVLFGIFVLPSMAISKIFRVQAGYCLP